MSPPTSATGHVDDAPPPLPTLTTTPTAYSGCCLALSAPFLTHLASLLPPAPALTLSIGSGFGLLEALLLAPPYPSHMIGVEVHPSPNKYLPATHHRTVYGTRFHEPLATEAACWMFVYPRRVGLVQEYMSECGEGCVEMVVWIGPRADWEEYEACFEGWEVQIKGADEVGGRAWELVAVAKSCT
jgi:hypothetical protein